MVTFSVMFDGCAVGVGRKIVKLGGSLMRIVHSC
jgi:hypothetical protein